MFPSEYEGFGAPVLEAMALGTPVVCSDRAALPEVAGDAALVLPLELDAWTGALDEVAARRDELVAAGRARAARVHHRGVGRRARRRLPPHRRRRPRSRRTVPMADRPLRLVVLCPHFEPDTAPTGRVMTRIVAELAARGHELHVVTALPWYRHHAIEPGWAGRLVPPRAARRGGRSGGSTRSPAATSATCVRRARRVRRLLAARRRGPGSPPAGGSAASTP